MKIDIRYDDTHVRNAINRLLRAGTDMTPAMRVVAGHLADSAAESFSRESSPDGQKWDALKSSTIRQREKQGYRAGPILERSGDLANQILADWDSTSAVAGTNTIYAATHQFGAARGAFGATSKGAPIPWGDIPARPFLGVWPEHENLIVRTMLDFIDKQWR